MLDELFTPVNNGYFAVTRWDTSVQPGVMQMFADHVYNAIAETRIRKEHIIPTLLLATEMKFGMRSADDDPNVVWICIGSAEADIALGAKRAGGLFLAVTQEVHDWLKPHQPSHMRCGWVIDNSVGNQHVLVAYHGMSGPDGGYPVKDHGDGSVTLYDVHALDIQYYRSVRFDAGAQFVSKQKVNLNW